ncbi:MAG: hypothetical protein M0P70_01435 [Desulfobulbaceae bacterium]|nr:hypothetical protein [Desulfobulbaceae bacterium]
MIRPSDLENFSQGCATTYTLNSPYSITSWDYLGFAKEDLKEEKEDRTLVNALSNAKRALHLQIDILTKTFGIMYINPKRRFDFPQKLDFCVKCGIVGPQILRKINRLRNAVEHEYYVPDINEVEDFIDITELFVAASDVILRNFPHDIEFRSPEIDLFGIPKRGVGIVIEPSQGKVIIHINDFIAEPRPNREDAEDIFREYKERSKNLRDGDPLPDLPDEVRMKYYRAISRKTKSVKIEFSVKDSPNYFEWVSFAITKRK